MAAGNRIELASSGDQFHAGVLQGNRAAAADRLADRLDCGRDRGRLALSRACRSAARRLIDFGATKVLAREERLAACLLYAALHRGDKDKVMEMVRVSGYRSKSFDEEVIYDLCRFGFDTFGQDLLRGKNVQTFMDDLYARDPWYEAASNLTMAQFLSIRLRGVGLSCGYPVVCSDWWGPLAIKILRDEGLPYESWDRDLMQKHLSGKTQLSKGATSLLDRVIR